MKTLSEAVDYIVNLGFNNLEDDAASSSTTTTTGINQPLQTNLLHRLLSQNNQKEEGKFWSILLFEPVQHLLNEEQPATPSKKENKSLELLLHAQLVLVLSYFASFNNDDVDNNSNKATSVDRIYCAFLIAILKSKRNVSISRNSVLDNWIVSESCQALFERFYISVIQAKKSFGEFLVEENFIPSTDNTTDDVPSLLVKIAENNNQVATDAKALLIEKKTDSFSKLELSLLGLIAMKTAATDSETDDANQKHSNNLKSFSEKLFGNNCELGLCLTQATDKYIRDDLWSHQQCSSTTVLVYLPSIIYFTLYQHQDDLFHNEESRTSSHLRKVEFALRRFCILSSLSLSSTEQKKKNIFCSLLRSLSTTFTLVTNLISVSSSSPLLPSQLPKSLRTNVFSGVLPLVFEKQSNNVYLFVKSTVTVLLSKSIREWSSSSPTTMLTEIRQLTSEVKQSADFTDSSSSTNSTSKSHLLLSLRSNLAQMTAAHELAENKRTKKPAITSVVKLLDLQAEPATAQIQPNPATASIHVTQALMNNNIEQNNNRSKRKSSSSSTILEKNSLDDPLQTFRLNSAETFSDEENQNSSLQQIRSDWRWTFYTKTNVSKKIDRPLSNVNHHQQHALLEFSHFPESLKSFAYQIFCASFFCVPASKGYPYICFEILKKNDPWFASGNYWPVKTESSGGKKSGSSSSKSGAAAASGSSSSNTALITETTSAHDPYDPWKNAQFVTKSAAQAAINASCSTSSSTINNNQQQQVIDPYLTYPFSTDKRGALLHQYFTLMNPVQLAKGERRMNAFLAYYCLALSAGLLPPWFSLPAILPEARRLLTLERTGKPLSLPLMSAARVNHGHHNPHLTCRYLFSKIVETSCLSLPLGSTLGTKNNSDNSLQAEASFGLPTSIERGLLFSASERQRNQRSHSDNNATNKTITASSSSSGAGSTSTTSSVNTTSTSNNYCSWPFDFENNELSSSPSSSMSLPPSQGGIILPELPSRGPEFREPPASKAFYDTDNRDPNVITRNCFKALLRIYVRKIRSSTAFFLFEAETSATAMKNSHPRKSAAAADSSSPISGGAYPYSEMDPNGLFSDLEFRRVKPGIVEPIANSENHLLRVGCSINTDESLKAIDSQAKIVSATTNPSGSSTSTGGGMLKKLAAIQAKMPSGSTASTSPSFVDQNDEQVKFRTQENWLSPNFDDLWRSALEVAQSQSPSLRHLIHQHCYVPMEMFVEFYEVLSRDSTNPFFREALLIRLMVVISTQITKFLVVLPSSSSSSCSPVPTRAMLCRLLGSVVYWRCPHHLALWYNIFHADHPHMTEALRNLNKSIASSESLSDVRPQSQQLPIALMFLSPVSMLDSVQLTEVHKRAVFSSSSSSSSTTNFLPPTHVHLTTEVLFKLIFVNETNTLMKHSGVGKFLFKLVSNPTKHGMLLSESQMKLLLDPVYQGNAFFTKSNNSEDNSNNNNQDSQQEQENENFTKFVHDSLKAGKKQFSELKQLISHEIYNQTLTSTSSQIKNFQGVISRFALVGPHFDSSKLNLMNNNNKIPRAPRGRLSSSALDFGLINTINFPFFHYLSFEMRSFATTQLEDVPRACEDRFFNGRGMSCKKGRAVASATGGSTGGDASNNDNDYKSRKLWCDQPPLFSNNRADDPLPPHTEQNYVNLGKTFRVHNGFIDPYALDSDVMHNESSAIHDWGNFYDIFLRQAVAMTPIGERSGCSDEVHMWEKVTNEYGVHPDPIKLYFRAATIAILRNNHRLGDAIELISIAIRILRPAPMNFILLRAVISFQSGRFAQCLSDLLYLMDYRKEQVKESRLLDTTLFKIMFNFSNLMLDTDKNKDGYPQTLRREGVPIRRCEPLLLPRGDRHYTPKQVRSFFETKIFCIADLKQTLDQKVANVRHFDAAAVIVDAFLLAWYDNYDRHKPLEGSKYSAFHTFALQSIGSLSKGLVISEVFREGIPDMWYREFARFIRDPSLCTPEAIASRWSLSIEPLKFLRLVGNYVIYDDPEEYCRQNKLPCSSAVNSSEKDDNNKKNVYHDRSVPVGQRDNFIRVSFIKNLISSSTPKSFAPSEEDEKEEEEKEIPLELNHELLHHLLVDTNFILDANPANRNLYRENIPQEVENLLLCFTNEMMSKSTTKSKNSQHQRKLLIRSLVYMLRTRWLCYAHPEGRRGLLSGIGTCIKWNAIDEAVYYFDCCSEPLDLYIASDCASFLHAVKGSGTSPCTDRSESVTQLLNPLFFGVCSWMTSISERMVRDAEQQQDASSSASLRNSLFFFAFEDTLASAKISSALSSSSVLTMKELVFNNTNNSNSNSNKTEVISLFGGNKDLFADEEQQKYFTQVVERFIKATKRPEMKELLNYIMEDPTEFGFNKAAAAFFRKFKLGEKMVMETGLVVRTANGPVVLREGKL